LLFVFHHATSRSDGLIWRHMITKCTLTSKFSSHYSQGQALMVNSKNNNTDQGRTCHYRIYKMSRRKILESIEE